MGKTKKVAAVAKAQEAENLKKKKQAQKKQVSESEVRVRTPRETLPAAMQLAGACMCHRNTVWCTVTHPALKSPSKTQVCDEIADACMQQCCHAAATPRADGPLFFVL